VGHQLLRDAVQAARMLWPGSALSSAGDAAWLPAG